MIKNTDSLTAVQGLINQLAPIFGFAAGFTFEPCLINAGTNLEKIYHTLDFTKKHLTNGATLSDKDFKDIVDKLNGYEVFTVTASAATAVLDVTATIHGTTNIKDSAKVLDSGLVLGHLTAPTIADTKFSKGGVGPFSHDVTGLIAETEYFVRAYVTTALGTFYSNEVTFTTTA